MDPSLGGGIPGNSNLVWDVSSDKILSLFAKAGGSGDVPELPVDDTGFSGYMLGSGGSIRYGLFITKDEIKLIMDFILMLNQSAM